MSMWLCGPGHLIHCPSVLIQLMKSGFFFLLFKLSHWYQVNCRDLSAKPFFISSRLFVPFIYLDSQIQVDTWLITFLDKAVTKVPVYCKCFSQLSCKGHSPAEIIVDPSVVRRAKAFAKGAVLSSSCRCALQSCSSPAPCVGDSLKLRH